MTTPSPAEGQLEAWAVALAEEMLGMLPRRWRHDAAVIARAREIRDIAGNDGDLLVAAAALHDLGCAPGTKRCRLEPLDAAWFLQGLGAPKRLINLVANLDCGSIEAEMRGLGSLHVFPDEEGVVRDALWYCCLTVGAEGQPTTFAERDAVMHEDYVGDPITVRFFETATPELKAAIRRTEERLADLQLTEPDSLQEPSSR